MLPASTARTRATSPPRTTRTSTLLASTARTRATKPDPVAGALTRCVGDPTTFRRSHWGVAPLHRRGSDTFADVLTLEDVDRIASSATRRPEIRLVQDGERVDPARYCTTLRLGGRRVSDVVDAAKLTARFAEGATVVLQSLHRTGPGVGRFLAGLEAELSHPVQANAYLTPAGAAGLAPHADSHDVIVVQLHGSKSWEVDGLGPVLLEPGHTMYLPAGTKHSAAAQGTSSLHLTIGILRVTYRDVLRRILDGIDDGPLDRPLPVGYTGGETDDLAAGIEGLLDHVTGSLSQLDPEDVVAAERRRRRPRVRHEGHLASVARLPELSPSSVVRLRPGPAPSLDVDGDRLRVRTGDRELGLPAGALAALRVVLRGEPVAVVELPDLDGPSQMVVARRLVREGVLVVVDEERSVR